MQHHSSLRRLQRPDSTAYQLYVAVPTLPAKPRTAFCPTPTKVSVPAGSQPDLASFARCSDRESRHQSHIPNTVLRSCPELSQKWQHCSSSTAYSANLFSK